MPLRPARESDLDAIIDLIRALAEYEHEPAAVTLDRGELRLHLFGPHPYAEVLIAEIGSDMTRFGSARQLASWAGMCPGNDESAGTHHGGQTRRGSPWLRSALVSSARSASRTKTYLGAQYRRLAARRGAKRAFVAVGHTILGIVYALLTSGEPFRDLGANYFDRRDAEHLTRRLTRRLEGLAYAVTLQPKVA